MNRDTVIALAREAGMPPIEITSDKPVLYPVPDAIERFAALVAAHEREECAKDAEAFGKTLEVDVGDCFAEAIRSRTQGEWGG